MDLVDKYKIYQDQPEKIFQALTYNKETGDFFWKEDRPVDHFKNISAYRVWKTRFSGKKAGHITKGLNTEYVSIRVFHKLYLAHRLAHLFVKGSWPENEVDHIDGNGLNNSWSNLRDVEKFVNGKNSQRKKNNSSGVNGVYWHKTSMKWVAEGHWTEDGVNKKKYLGIFEKLEDAAQARLEWEQQIGGFGERHGKPA